MKGDLFTIKQQTLMFYKKLLKEWPECSPSARVYLTSCIEVLEAEFKKEKEASISYYSENEELVKNLQELGLSRNQSRMMDLVMQNKRIPTNEIYKLLQMPRTESYHIITKLSEYGLLHILPSWPRVIVLAERGNNPLGPWIERKKNELAKMETIANNITPKLINK